MALHGSGHIHSVDPDRIYLVACVRSDRKIVITTTFHQTIAHRTETNMFIIINMDGIKNWLENCMQGMIFTDIVECVERRAIHESQLIRDVSTVNIDCGNLMTFHRSNKNTLTIRTIHGLRSFRNHIATAFGSDVQSVFKLSKGHFHRVGSGKIVERETKGIAQSRQCR